MVGLGNPGKEYANTRHNAGFMTVAGLLEKLPGKFEAVSRYESEIFVGRCRGRKLIVQMPTTYMNRSGEAVRKLMTALGLAPENLLVIYDDMDIPFGRLRLRDSGSDGGHRGMESIIAELGSGQFARLRVGIGQPNAAEVVDFVLSPFGESEQAKLAKVLDTAANAAKTALVRGLSAAMNQYNRWEYQEENNNGEGEKTPEPKGTELK